MKFCSRAEQARLRGAHMQTFIIEQQAFIIHVGGFPCSPQINYESALHTHSSMLKQTGMNIQSLADFADRILVCEFILPINKPRAVETKCIVGCVRFIPEVHLGSCTLIRKTRRVSGLSLATIKDSFCAFLGRMAASPVSLCIFHTFPCQRACG